MNGTKDQQKHLVLVHGACHGAWCWYKVKPRLEQSGHRVTVIDLAGSGIDTKRIQEVHSFKEYCEPLLKVMSSLGPKEKVILVGHSLGGMNLAVASEMWPGKVSVAVFLTAFMPDAVHRPSYVLDEICDGGFIKTWMDTETSSYDTSNGPLTTLFFGPNFLSTKLYNQCLLEDLELAKTLIRPGSLFREDLINVEKFTDEAYGSVPRVYIKCSNDECILKEFQCKMIENAGVNEVMEINGADHMAMFSKTEELCSCLLEIAKKYH